MSSDPAPPPMPRLADVRGQEAATRALRAALGADGVPPRIAGAYILHGPDGVGRSLAARAFAAALLCADPQSAVPCGSCRPCRLLAAGTHPDLLIVSAQTGPRFKDDGEALRAGPGQFTRAHHVRVKRGPRRGIQVRALRRLLDLLSLSAAAGGRKVVVLDSLDEIEEEGAATLLKSLEEPPPATTFLVLAGDLDGVPDTIVSRCQRVRFRPLAPDVVGELLVEHAAGKEPLEPRRMQLLVRLAQGSAGRAIAAAESGLHEAAEAAAADLLEDAGPRGVLRATTWCAEAGRDLAARRERVRGLLALTLLHVRDRAARSGSVAEIEALVPALASGLEAVGANVSPELVLHALWARVRRARRRLA